MWWILKMNNQIEIEIQFELLNFILLLIFNFNFNLKFKFIKLDSCYSHCKYNTVSVRPSRIIWGHELIKMIIIIDNHNDNHNKYINWLQFCLWALAFDFYLSFAALILVLKCVYLYYYTLILIVSWS